MTPWAWGVIGAVVASVCATLFGAFFTRAGKASRALDMEEWRKEFPTRKEFDGQRDAVKGEINAARRSLMARVEDAERLVAQAGEFAKLALGQVGETRDEVRKSQTEMRDFFLDVLEKTTKPITDGIEQNRQMAVTVAKLATDVSHLTTAIGELREDLRGRT